MVDVTRGSRRSGGSSGSPLAAASSTTAVRPPSISPNAAFTGSPSGPSTVTVTSSPPRAATSASTVPSPPSASGTSATWASRKTSRMPSAIARAAAGAPREPLYGLGAATSRTSGRSVDPGRPVQVLRVVGAHRREVDALQLVAELTDASVPDGPSIDLDHGGDLRPGPAQKQLVARVQLGAVDAPLENRHAQLVPDQADDQTASDPLENVVCYRRRHEDPVFENEQVLRRALGHVPALREDDRLVEAVLQRLRLRKRRVDVRTGHLCTSRQRAVRNPPPARDSAADAAVDLDVLAHRRGVDQKAVGKPMQLYADLLRRREEQRADVGVRSIFVAPKKLERELHQLDGAVWE